MNVAQALAQAGEMGVERLDAQLLLLHALGRSSNDRGWLLAHDTDPVAEEAGAAFAAASERRAAGEPLAYIVGHKEFHGLDLLVDSRVLVPRPDTETLVDWAVELMRSRESPRVIDLGTGSGAIALAIKKSLPHARVEACDISAGAIEIAAGNAKRLGLEVHFSRASWLDGSDGTYDLVVSNPPYIRAADPHLAALRHEPPSALVSGTDGLDDSRRIVAQAPSHLAQQGWLLLEHGYDQAAAVRELLHAAGFGYVASRRDLAGIERCTGGMIL
jgi:release factor glutamine methyltransferase